MGSLSSLQSPSAPPAQGPKFRHRVIADAGFGPFFGQANSRNEVEIPRTWRAVFSNRSFAGHADESRVSVKKCRVKELLFALTSFFLLAGCAESPHDPAATNKTADTHFDEQVTDSGEKVDGPLRFEECPSFNGHVDTMTQKQAETLEKASEFIRKHGGEGAFFPGLADHGDARLEAPQKNFLRLFYRCHRFDGEFVVPPEMEWHDADVAVIRVIPNLEHVGILNGPFSDDALIHLRGRTDVKSLTLSVREPVICRVGHRSGGCRCAGEHYHGQRGFTAAAATHLSGLTELTFLDVEGIAFTDDSLRSLAGLTKLGTLILRGTEVSDAGLTHLRGLKRLGSLYLEGTKVTSAGVRQFNGTLPSCQVHR